MPQTLLRETACAILSLTTRIAWTEDLPKPMSRRTVSRMLASGVLSGLVLRNTLEVEESFYERARALLTRVSDVYDRLEAYESAGYTLLMRGDTHWPDSLCAMREDEPLFLFAKGDVSQLGGRRIAVAGSRRILPETRAAAEKTGRMIAEASSLLVTGGAAGVDTAALYGALNAGGPAGIVPAMPAARILSQKPLARAYEGGRLLLLCDTLPDEPFSAAKALGRNHTIYALGEAALVVAARENKGGSWRGATDCLRGGFAPVYVWNGQNADTAGSRALLTRGAKPYTLDKPLEAQLSASLRQTSMFAANSGV